VYLADEARVRADPLLKPLAGTSRLATLVAKREGSVFHWDIRLQGVGETSFSRYEAQGGRRTVSASLTSRTLARPSFEAAFEPPAFLAAMLAFESALAQSQAEEGLIPPAAAGEITRACDCLEFDVDALVADAKRQGRWSCLS
jgi:hypothetical protein